MKRFFRVLTLVSLITLAASCKKDDDGAIQIRDYTVQYATEKPDIEEYLKSHYIVSVDADYNVVIDSISNPNTQVSIWDQTEYPLQSKEVHSLNEDNTPLYTIYYIMLNQGVGDQPTRADNVVAAYRGIRLNGTQFDYNPFPSAGLSLANTIEAWQEIIPLFKAGTYVDIPGSPDPATFENYGAGLLFTPSGMGYYHQPQGTLLPAYSPLVFSFKLFSVQYVDTDGDGILSRYETDGTTDIAYYDTDGDGIPNYRDADDDGDGYPTATEIKIPNTGTGPTNPVRYYEFNDIPTCSGGTIKKHLDPSCH